MTSGITPITLMYLASTMLPSGLTQILKTASQNRYLEEIAFTVYAKCDLSSKLASISIDRA